MFNQENPYQKVQIHWCIQWCKFDINVQKSPFFFIFKSLAFILARVSHLELNFQNIPPDPWRIHIAIKEIVQFSWLCLLHVSFEQIIDLNLMDLFINFPIFAHEPNRIFKGQPMIILRKRLIKCVLGLVDWLIHGVVLVILAGLEHVWGEHVVNSLNLVVSDFEIGQS